MPTQPVREKKQITIDLIPVKFEPMGVLLIGCCRFKIRKHLSESREFSTVKLFCDLTQECHRTRNILQRMTLIDVDCFKSGERHMLATL